jgi:hypothetical protein
VSLSRSSRLPEERPRSAGGVGKAGEAGGEALEIVRRRLLPPDGAGTLDRRPGRDDSQGFSLRFNRVTSASPLPAPRSRSGPRGPHQQNRAATRLHLPSTFREEASPWATTMTSAAPSTGADRQRFPGSFIRGGFSGSSADLTALPP